MSLVSVSGWVVGVSFVIYTMDWYSLNTTVNSHIFSHNVFLCDSCYIYILMIFIDFTVFMCQNSYKLINTEAEYGKSVGGAETKCKGGQRARHYEMLRNL